MLLFFFEHPATIALGVVLLCAFIGCGLFLIASPENLARKPDEPEM